jgi:Tol biopolymer transport system component
VNFRVALLVLAATLFGVAIPAGAAAAEGPRLAIIASGQGKERVITTGPSGQQPRTLLENPEIWSLGERISWSADGALLAFSASGPFQAHPGGRFGSGWPLVGVLAASGEAKVFPPAFLNAGDPVLSPDGQTAFFARAVLVKELPGRENLLFRSSIWSVDLSDGFVKQRTKGQLGFPIALSSLSPDGLSLAGTRYGRNGLEAVAIDLRSKQVTVLAKEASEPMYSPDGSQIAFVRWKNWRESGADDGSPPINELRVAQVGDAYRSRLVLVRASVLAWPSWDPSGSRLSFTQTHVVENGDSGPARGNKVMAVNADGTCPIRVYTDPKLSLSASAWQPGAGREAGPISC